MYEVSIGAIGAAMVAGLISLIGLIIGKEQKVSEFRQFWIDELRQCFVNYLASLNAVADIIRLKNSGKNYNQEDEVESFRKLNEASHGIIFRINLDEDIYISLKESMNEFDKIISDWKNINIDEIKASEEKFIYFSNKCLKYEWKRVKKGEPLFYWSVRISIASIILLFSFLIFSNYNTSQEKVFDLYKVIDFDFVSDG